jgi:hypothetical protein
MLYVVCHWSPEARHEVRATQYPLCTRPHAMRTHIRHMLRTGLPMLAIVGGNSASRKPLSAPPVAPCGSIQIATSTPGPRAVHPLRPPRSGAYAVRAPSARGCMHTRMHPRTKAHTHERPRNTHARTPRARTHTVPLDVLGPLAVGLDRIARLVEGRIVRILVIVDRPVLPAEVHPLLVLPAVQHAHEYIHVSSSEATRRPVAEPQARFGGMHTAAGGGRFGVSGSLVVEHRNAVHRLLRFLVATVDVAVPVVATLYICWHVAGTARGSLLATSGALPAVDNIRRRPRLIAQGLRFSAELELNLPRACLPVKVTSRRSPLAQSGPGGCSTSPARTASTSLHRSRAGCPGSPRRQTYPWTAAHWKSTSILWRCSCRDSSYAASSGRLERRRTSCRGRSKFRSDQARTQTPP